MANQVFVWFPASCLLGFVIRGGAGQGAEMKKPIYFILRCRSSLHQFRCVGCRGFVAKAEIASQIMHQRTLACNTMCPRHIEQLVFVSQARNEPSASRHR